MPGKRKATTLTKQRGARIHSNGVALYVPPGSLRAPPVFLTLRNGCNSSYSLCLPNTYTRISCFAELMPNVRHLSPRHTANLMLRHSITSSSDVTVLQFIPKVGVKCTWEAVPPSCWTLHKHHIEISTTNLSAIAAFKTTTHFTESIRLFLFSDSAAYSFGSGCTVVLWACPDRPDCIQDIFAWAQQHPKDMHLHAGDGAASISVESRQELRACCDGVTETIKRKSGSKQVRQYHGEISFFIFHFSFPFFVSCVV